MQNFQKNIAEALRSLKIADHMTYVTYPLVKETKILLKIFNEIYNSILNCIRAILNYEYFYKRINLYSDEKENIKSFIDEYYKKYKIKKEHIKKIKEILEIYEKHKSSPLEFAKKEKIVILSDNLSVNTLDLRKIKEYLLLAKEIFLKTNKIVNQ